MTLKHYFSVKSHSNNNKRVWMHCNGVCMTVRYNSCFVELYPILTHCWSIPYLITLSKFDRYEKDCWRLSRNVVGNPSESSNRSPNSIVKKWPEWVTNRQLNTYMYFYGHKFKTITMKGNPVDQTSCNSFGELIHECQAIHLYK